MLNLDNVRNFDWFFVFYSTMMNTLTYFSAFHFFYEKGMFHVLILLFPCLLYLQKKFGFRIHFHMEENSKDEQNVRIYVSDRFYMIVFMIAAFTIYQNFGFYTTILYFLMIFFQFFVDILLAFKNFISENNISNL
jgi:hypothetical protein